MNRNIQEWKALQQAIIRLEDLAKELNFCIIVLAQLNRDGEISASHRATFSAHTVLNFRDHPTLGPVIDAKKNRHGKKDSVVTVDYTEISARITEKQQVKIDRKAEQRNKAGVRDI